MVTVTLDEITLNATRAALDRRVTELRVVVGIWERKAPGEDRDRALVWNIAALNETEMAREFFAEVSITEHPVDATWTAA